MVSIMSSQIRLEGMLEKFGTGVLRNKTKVWMTLDDSSLAYYRAERRSSCIGSVDVSEITSVDLSGDGIEFEVTTNNKSVKFAAGSNETAKNWVESLKLVISQAAKTGGGADDSAEKRGSSQYQKEVETLPSLSAGSSIFGVKLNPRRSRLQSSKSLSKPDNEAPDGHSQDNELVKETNDSEDMGVGKSKFRRKKSERASTPVSPSALKGMNTVFEDKDAEKHDGGNILRDSAGKSTERQAEKKTDSTTMTSETKDDGNSKSSIAQFENVCYAPSRTPDNTIVHSTSGGSINGPTPSQSFRANDVITDDTGSKQSENKYENISPVPLRKSKLNSSSEETKDINKVSSKDKASVEDQTEHEINTSPVMMRKSRSSRSSLSSRSNASMNSIDMRKQNKVSATGRMDLQNTYENVAMECSSVPPLSNPSLRTVSESDNSESDDEEFEKNDALFNAVFAMAPNDKIPVRDKPTNGLYLSNTAFLKLKQLYEQDSEHFELNIHQIANPDAVQRLKELVASS